MLNFTNILDGISSIDGETTLESVRQISNSMGTVINNKDYVINSSAVSQLVYFFYFFFNNIILYCLTRLLTKHFRCPGKQKVI